MSVCYATPSGSIVALLTTVHNPDGSIVASRRCRSLCSFRSFPPLCFIRHRRRSATEPRFIRRWRRFGYGAPPGPVAQSSPCFANARMVRFASRLHPAHFRHWRGQDYGASKAGRDEYKRGGRGSLVAPLGYDHCRFFRDGCGKRDFFKNDLDTVFRTTAKGG